MTREPAPSPSGLRGFPLLFCVSLAVVAPAWLLTLTTRTAARSWSFLGGVPRLAPAVALDVLAGAVTAAAGVSAGIGLWKRRPRALEAAELVLLLFVGAALFQAGLPVLVDWDRPEPMPPFATPASVALAAVHALVWHLYLARSRRVRAAYR